MFEHFYNVQMQCDTIFEQDLNHKSLVQLIEKTEPPSTHMTHFTVDNSKFYGLDNAQISHTKCLLK